MKFLNKKAILGGIAAAGLAGFVLFSVLGSDARTAAGKAGPDVSYSTFLAEARAGKVAIATVTASGANAIYKNGKTAHVNAVPDPTFVPQLMAAGVDVQGAASAAPEPASGGTSAVWQVLLAFGPVALMIGLWLYFMKRQSGAKANPQANFGKSRAKRKEPSSEDVTFADIAGCDEAKAEVFELVEFLRDPAKFQKLGGRIPKGVLLNGPPGTGKTLLARAIAGEAKVPFYTIAGSDFVEMFVGVGASRVRDLFEQAKKNAPAIIFIDEIDAVGRKRGAGHGGGNDEREQTLNAMLVEMDGFEKDAGVIVIAATNRPDVLDNALMRPGRFDRQVYVSLPDVRGREEILNVHMRKVPAGADVNIPVLARGTAGMSGADLGNLVNEAALFAARRNSRHVNMGDFEDAKDKTLLGAERKSMVMPEEERRNTAYHEAGHAVMAELLDKTDPVHMVTIIPRGRALGVTMQLPEGDRYSTDKERLENTIAVLFGGRVAEVLYMKQATTGASNDYERATQIARNMVTRWGYSDVLGPMVLAANETDPGAAQFVSPETLREVDHEIRGLLVEQYERVTKMLGEHGDKMHAMAAALLEYETIDVDQIGDVMAGRPVRPPKRAKVTIAKPDVPATVKGEAPVGVVPVAA